MRKLLLLTIALIFQFNITAQTSSVFHIETEYTTINGYRYYFDKLDPQTGISTRITQLPVIGFFTGYGFFNCFGNYVFQGIDTTMPNGDYVNKLYELDTLGNLIRTIPMDTASGTWYKACLPAAGSPYYYALRWSTTAGQWVLETINAVNGSRVTQTLPSLVNYSYWNSDAAITRSDILWFGMDNQMMGTSVLISVDPFNGSVTFADTIVTGTGYYYDGLNYDCANDTIYGFISHMDSLNNAELFKVHGASGTVIYSGSTVSGSGIFSAGNHTRLADGRFYFRTNGPAYLLPDFYVTSPVFTIPTTVTPATLSIFCFAAPRESCSFYTPCQEVSGVGTVPERNELNVFPNPADGALNIEAEGWFTAELTDYSGRVVKILNSNSTVNIPVADLAEGIYILRVKTEGSIRAEKIVVSHR